MIWNTPIDWEHGLFLQPQHFQYTELNQHYIHSQFLRYVTPFFWGFTELVINEKSLKSGVFDVEKMAFFLPSGEFIEVDVNAKFLPRSFIADWPVNANSLKVYIGVKQLSKNVGNVTVVDDMEKLAGVSTRYISWNAGDELPDYYHQGAQAHLRSLYYVVKLFWESEIENTHNYSIIQAAELKRINNEIFFESSFYPSCVSIVAHKNLHELMNQILNDLVKVTSKLEQFKQPIDSYSSQIDNSNFGRLFSLRSLLRNVPFMKHLLSAKDIHPWQIYGLLQQIIGELSFYSTDVNFFEGGIGSISALPVYDHSDLSKSFNLIASMMTKLLFTIMADPDRIRRLVKEKNHYFADLGTHFIQQGRNYFLVIYAQNDQEEIAEMIKDFGKLCSYTEIENYIDFALPGAPVSRLLSAPDGVPKGANCLYYKIDHKSSMWSKVERECKVAFYVGKAPVDIIIDIVAVGG
ncbi:type VI secretion system baseplate subunit TssK [Legionella maioricensis]|uniref:Type VI secretion system baseplate subunit TssK n=1 Tax=Legionella maioricensis TaxID=2896528 RepID=A0A9X2IBH3_9GAMM|nr:type VI secretion system baseplate subunit TssK [Legionella maioricensis]MCL9684919.1 type VI secretion system baseplate subunit TssK [Legionella maioricensis]MCL9688249.1 type VI secretion system baseplate subunit TssK [Legionella maioricensis]